MSHPSERLAEFAQAAAGAVVEGESEEVGRMTTMKSRFTAPGMSTNDGSAAAGMLQDRLAALTDLSLTLKHVHWNVVGPHFIAVHKMLDPQVKAVRRMVDTLAERIATLGASPVGTLTGLAKAGGQEEYPLGRADALVHLSALDRVYDTVIANHRQAMAKLEDLDQVSQDILIQQTADLEQFQWFVRAHLETPSGELTHPEGGTSSNGSRSRSKN
jgi:starvation-inducible DNA-binding protein